MDTVAFWVKLLSLEFPWLGSITSQGKTIVLSHKHKHMHKVHVYTQPHAHPTQFLMQFTEPCPIMAWCYHISKNTGFSPNTWFDQGRNSCTEDVEKILVLSGAQPKHIITAELCDIELACCQSDWWSADQWSHHQAQLTAVKLQPGTSTCSLLVTNVI